MCGSARVGVSPSACPPTCGRCIITRWISLCRCHSRLPLSPKHSCGAGFLRTQPKRSLSLSPPPGHRSRSRLPGARPTHAVGWERSVKKRIAPVEFSFSLSLSIYIYTYIHIYIYYTQAYKWHTHIQTECVQCNKQRQIERLTSVRYSRQTKRTLKSEKQSANTNTCSDRQTDRYLCVCVCIHTQD